MNEERRIKQALREWIAQANGRLAPDEIDDRTPLMDERIITSLQVTDLLFVLEDLRGALIDVEDLQAGAFRDIHTIYHTFFARADD